LDLGLLSTHAFILAWACVGVTLGGIGRLLGFFWRWEIGVNWWLFWGQDWDGYGRLDLAYYSGTFEEF